jgi:acyl-CoA synthetase (NDP forming)
MGTLTSDFSKLFDPKTIAVIGASDSEGKVGNLVFKQLMRSKRELYPVNPKGESIYGYKVYKEISDLPENIDLAITTVSAGMTLDAVEAIIKKNIAFVIIVAGGFSEIGPQGREIEENIYELCKGSGTRVLGPNSLGIFLPEENIDSIFVEHGDQVLEKGGSVACVLQSGSVGIESIWYAASIGFGMRAFVGLGNKLDLSEIDFLDYFSKDEKTKCLAFYLESIDRGREFLEAAKRVSAKKPVVILKAGRTKTGMSAVSLHTGKLAGDDKLVDDAFKQFGIQRAADEEEYIDMSKTLSMLPPAPGNRVAVVTPAGGYGIMATDYIEDESSRVKLAMARLSDASKKRIRDATFSFASCSNPVDITATANDAMFAESIDALVEDENVDIVICITFFAPPGITKNLADLVAERVKKSAKPIIVFSTYGTYTESVLEGFYRQGVAGFPSILRAVKAARYLVERAQILEKMETA